MNDLVEIKFFDSTEKANLASKLLEKNGIKSWVTRRGQELPGDMGDAFGAYLFIAKKDLKRAIDILEPKKDN